ncbi:MAG TPA: neutral zinc metallopeptidase [Gemmatimonadales bacterium]|nr:neutral zinc metallopeptidase [Gemmatimonadales bacterium]
MRLSPTGRSKNLEDRRGARGFGGGGFGRLGIGGIIIVIILAVIFKQNPLALIGMVGGAGGAAPPAVEAPVEDAGEEPMVRFLSAVLDSTQSFWAGAFQRGGGQYQDARLVLFRDATSTACGYGQSASGPFYCPGDQNVYIDLGFYEELHNRFGAPGDFAQAYVLAHEIGHHVQHLLGTERQVRELQRQRPDQANQLSVLMELQADCYAGAWGHRAAQQGILEPGDVEEGLGAAAAVGDDRLQRSQTGTVSPDAFTHGTSEQRMTWFRRGFQSGDPDACDTFGEFSGR